MSNEEPKSEVVTNPEPPADPPPAPAKPFAVHLSEEVSARVKASGDAIRELVFNKLVEEEVTGRAAMLTTALSKRSEMDREFRKLKADLVTLSEDGKPLTEGWSPKAVEHRKKAKEQLDKLDRLITNAANNNDFAKLKEYLGPK